jgi:hypothetical protein
MAFVVGDALIAVIAMTALGGYVAGRLVLLRGAVP